MFASDDDTDFVPTSSSKLASLFGRTQATDESNATFTFAAPKQPKKIGSIESVGQASSKTASLASVKSDGSNKLSIIIVKAVHTYLLENGQYNPQGKLGAAILGNSTTHIYQLLLYKGKQQHITSTTIKPEFRFTVQPNNYSTFYNDQGQNWSLHFEDDADGEEFAREVGLARAASQGDGDCIQRLLTQVLSVPSTVSADAPGADVGDTMEIYYTVQTYAAGKLGQSVESNREASKPQRVKIRTNVWEEGLIGAATGTKRMIMLPPSIVGPWKSAVPPGTSLVVDVSVGRLKQARSSPRVEPSMADSSEGSVTDDQSIKARVASISEALTNSPKTHKASIINRMARMGQPTLLLKGAIACNPSDSEETGDESSLPSTNVNYKPTKNRTSKSRPFASHSSPSVESHTSPNNTAPPATNPPSQLTLYQQVPVGWQQQQQQAYSIGPYGQYHSTDGQLFPMHGISSHQLYPSPPSTTAVTSPTIPSPDLAVFFSESRTHNAEVRMAVSKITDKVDQVLTKLDTVQARRPNYSEPTLDSSSLLASVQKIVQENNTLKTELEEKRNKLEVQNDRIYQLLNTNHKYLEQSNTSSIDQETVITTLQQDKARLIAELSDVRSMANSLQMKEDSRKRDENEIASMTALIETQKAELAVRTDYVSEQESKLEALKDKLKQTSDANESHEKTISEMRSLMNDMQSCKDGLEKGLSEVTHQLNVHKSEAERHINHLHAKYTAQITTLETMGDCLRAKFETLKSTSEPPNINLVVAEVKKVMNIVWKTLQLSIHSDTKYDGTTIREILLSTLQDVTCQFVEARTRVTSEKAVTVPVERQASGDTDEVPIAKEKVIESEDDYESVEDIPSLGEGVSNVREEPKVAEMPIRQRLNNSASPVTTHSLKGETLSESNIPGQPKPTASGVTETLSAPPVKPIVEHAKEKIPTSKTEDLEGWRPQPPPPPLFDDEDDEDDWLI